MEKAKIKELVGKLQMQPELQPLFESGEADNGGNLVGETAYEKFERAVEDCLSRYGDGRSPSVKRKYNGKPRTVNDFNEAREVFRRYYGMGCAPQKLEEIGDEIFGTAQLTKRQIARTLKKPEGKGHLDYWHPNLHNPERKPNRQSKASYLVVFVTELLRQRHKRDIWYGML